MSLLFVCLPAQGTGQTATKYDIKTLTVCTGASQLVSRELLKSDESGKWLTCSHYFLYEYLRVWPNMQMKHVSVCVYTCVRPVCSISVELHIMYRVLIKCYCCLPSHRTVFSTSFAVFQLWWDGVSKCGPVLGPLPRVRANCQQPAGHWYCAAATATHHRGC